jgi:hypothetical protein
VQLLMLVSHLGQQTLVVLLTLAVERRWSIKIVVALVPRSLALVPTESVGVRVCQVSHGQGVSWSYRAIFAIQAITI